MSAPNDGGPAFPLFAPPSETGDNILPIQFGMTLRDYFAGQAITGMLYDQFPSTPADFANKSYEIADAMLAARSKSP